ncbi:MFS transporter [Micromonospora phytophila]|uniref:MFS transporter n=1 Tax=Micromonospora phytophila TaxID=709888 RepID=UPI00202EFCEE|nr:MFS transporter [Micromonospora phytophila]MCM0673196.1 MFS transporter [Micromonospora phytophila]
MLVAGLFLFSASSLVGGLATALESLVGARVAQGVGAAMLAPATLAVINTYFTEPQARARAFGAWSASGGVGGMAGALAGGAITTGLSWRWVFLINVPIGAVLIVLAMMSLVGTRANRRESLDLTGAVTGTAGLAALIYGVMQSADHGWTSVRVLGPAGTGLLLLVIFTTGCRGGGTFRHPTDDAPAAVQNPDRGCQQRHAAAVRRHRHCDVVLHVAIHAKRTRLQRT